ncbi:hypothetical protein P7K49_032292, partial [Saguinus oedipus]
SPRPHTSHSVVHKSTAWCGCETQRCSLPPQRTDLQPEPAPQLLCFLREQALHLCSRACQA